VRSLHPQLPGLRIRPAGREAGIRSYGLVTNGALVERERAPSLRRAGLAIAQVSLDGVDEADHRAVRTCATS
jgi:MoaA/NifB/PqqE/SkfB family radical SAM enzyme